jgi:uncharacterized protein (TIGR02217 family)
MSDFHDVRFPLALGFGASGGPEFTTETTLLANGAEHRNTPRALPRRRFDASPAIRSQQDLIALQSFFMARKGRLHSFRFRDPFDHLSCAHAEEISPSDQSLGLGDGQTVSFQLLKTYEGNNVPRPITKPDAPSVVMAVNGVEVSSSDFTVDDGTGLVTFNTAPLSGATITAGFAFDCVVRFDTDALDISLEDFGAGVISAIPLVELLYV